MTFLLLVTVAFAAKKPKDPLGPIPPQAAEHAFTPPTPTELALANGAKLWVLEDRTLPLVSVRVTVPGGSAADPAGKEGRAALSDAMMARGAGELDAEAFAQDLARHAIDLQIETGRFDSTIVMSMKRDQLDHALSLLSDAISEPWYAKKETKREQAIEAAALETAANEPVAVATQVAYREWFGAGHAYGKPPAGTIDGMRALTRKDVIAYHSQAWNAAGATITIAGDLAPGEAKERLDAHLGAWETGSALRVAATPVTATGRRILLVDRPGATQTMFFLVFPGARIGDASTAAQRIGAITLGGTFTSRLNRLLRETKGYTYGVRANLDQLPEGGVRTIGTRIRTDATGPAMQDLAAELAKVAAGVTPAEADKARGAFRQDQVEAVESLSGMVRVYGSYQAAGLGPDALAKDLAAMSTADAAAIGEAFRAWTLDQALLVFVGDKAVIEGPLKEAGFGELTTTDVR
jgi:predicted Zn-dependent peptidase